MASAANPSHFGEAVTFPATVTSPAGPSGTATFRDDGTVVTGCEEVTLDATGRADVRRDGTAVGTHPITGFLQRRIRASGP